MKTQIKTAKETKKETIAKLVDKIKRAKSITCANYRGLTAVQINTLRKKIKEAKGELVIAKNNLLKIALTRNQLPAPENQLEGPTASIFAYEDEIAPIRIVADSFKNLGLPNFKFGFFGKDLLDGSSLEALSKIQSRDVLLAKLVGTLNSPVYAVVSVISANIRNLVSVLDQVSKKQSRSA